MGQGKNRTVIINLNSKLLKFMASLFSDSDGETASEESANEETNEQPDTTDMPDFESGESAEQRNEEGEVLKVLTPDQMLSRLSIFFGSVKSRK